MIIADLVVFISILAYSASMTAPSPSLWKCDNGQSIAEAVLCDGRPDCSDGSDETAEYCLGRQCTDNEFLCAYGACIPKEWKCNFVKDCADNSDETEYLCFKNPIKRRKELKGNCPINGDMQCKSGECIPYRKRCNGVLDCEDGTDETVDLCSTVKCASYAFRCGYGACIPGKSKCNGIVDCADGSDEAVGLCGNKRKEILDDNTPVISSITTKDCFIPSRIKNLVIEDKATNQTIVYGDKVEHGATIKFHCKPNSILDGVKEKKCIDTEWMAYWPTCTVPKNLTKCQENQWQCDDGECIRQTNLCDGYSHCADKSDETTEACGENQCPPTNFRCNYGGCVAKNVMCDKAFDCADKSDELPLMCEQNKETKKKMLQGKCGSPLYIQCESGECIEGMNRCNGVPDCKDGSDETMNLCYNFRCPSYAFRCIYGGCVAGTDKCDGIINCADGSDEAAYTCSRPPKKPDSPPDTSPPKKTDSLPDTLPPKKPFPPKRINNNNNVSNKKACTIPIQPIPHLIAFNPSNGSGQKDLRPGSQVNTNTQIYFRCENDWHIIGSRITKCVNGNWATALPRCEKYCPHLTLDKGISTNPTCFYNEKVSNCSADLPIGTRAQIRCAIGYHLPASTSLESQHVNLTCDDNGEWDYPKFKCSPDCSSLSDSTYVSILKRDPKNIFKPACGGAIISPKIIISAEGCFTESMTTIANDPLLYNAVIGNYMDEYQEGSNIGMPVHSISEIIFLDYLQENEGDSIAALVVSNYIKFSESVKPICFESLIRASIETESSIIETEDDIDKLQGSIMEYEYKGGLFSVVVGYTEGALIVVNHLKLQLQQELKHYNYLL